MKHKSLLVHLLLIVGLLWPNNIIARNELENPTTVGDNNSYDYIVVGVGAAGAILARKLSDRNESVLALDLGEFRYDDPIILSPNIGAVIEGVPVITSLSFDPRYAKIYPIPIGGTDALTYSEGQGSIGGGAAHNFLAAVRGTPSIYDAWAAASGDPRWIYNNLLPKMKALEHFYPNVATPPDPSQRGFTGPISITQAPPFTSLYLTTTLPAASNSITSLDYNNPNQGITVVSTPQSLVTPGPNSRRSYSALEFLPMTGPGAVIDAEGNGLNGRRLKVQASARVIKINFDDRHKAVSVDYILTKDNCTEIRTAYLNNTGKLVLSAGAIQTPNLLLHSGVGPQHELSTLGIPVVLNSPNVGKNFQTHFGASALIAGNTGTGFAFIDGNGPSVSPPFLLPEGVRRLQIISQGFGAVSSSLAFLLNPFTRGSVNLVSADPLIDPEIVFPLYDPATGQDQFATPGTDANLIVRYLKIILDAATDAGLVVLQPSPAVYAGGDAALFAYARDLTNAVIAIHGAGTARMGTDISNSVVDGRLKVHGLRNVYIGDASVQPLLPDGNTNLSVYYTALELAAILGYDTPPAL